MLFKKSVLGRKYTRLITGSPRLFVSFILFGVALFLLLTLTTQIDAIKTYSAEVISLEGEIVLSAHDATISAGLAYIYSNKNDVLYPVMIERIEKLENLKNMQNSEYDILDKNIILFINKEGQDIVKSLSAEIIFIDIPQGKETLLYRIFVKGGKGN